MKWSRSLYSPPVVLESLVSSVEFYHGSPYRSDGNFVQDFETRHQGGMLFLTPSRSVASEYMRPLPQAGFKPQKAVHKHQPTIYTFQVNCPDQKVFNTNQPAHLELFKEIVSLHNRSVNDPDDTISRDLIWTHARPDASTKLAGQFPGWGSGLSLVPLLKARGFRAMWFSEGSQGPSLAVFYPKQDVALTGSFDS